MTIDDRLREERLRLGLKQTDFIKLSGKSKQTIIAYEKGATSPDAVFLAAIAAVGADVQYIITGIRSLTVAEKSPDYQVLRKDQKALLDNWEHCPKGVKDAIQRMAFYSTHPDDDDGQDGGLQTKKSA